MENNIWKLLTLADWVCEVTDKGLTSKIYKWLKTAKKADNAITKQVEI